MRGCAGSHPCVSGVVLYRPSAELPMALRQFPHPHPDLFGIQLRFTVSFGIVSSRDSEIHHTSTFFTVKVKPACSIFCFLLHPQTQSLKKLLPPQLPETENGASCIRLKNNHLSAPVGKEQLCGKINKHQQLLQKS